MRSLQPPVCSSRWQRRNIAGGVRCSMQGREQGKARGATPHASADDESSLVASASRVIQERACINKLRIIAKIQHNSGSSTSRKSLKHPYI